MAFRAINYEEGKVIHVPAATTTTITKGNALTYSSGYVTNAAAGTATDIYLVADETVTTTANGQLIRAYPTVGVLFEADCDAVWSVADQGTLADLGGAGTINPDASSNDLFFIVKGVGIAETDTKVVGFFQHANES